ncbi:hypothetical protein D3C78_746840 [compost metagenome]
MFRALQHFQEFIAGAEHDIACGKDLAAGGGEDNLVAEVSKIGDLKLGDDFGTCAGRMAQKAGRQLCGIGGGRYIAEDGGGPVQPILLSQFCSGEEAGFDASFFARGRFGFQRARSHFVSGEIKRLLALHAAGDAKRGDDFLQTQDGACGTLPCPVGRGPADHLSEFRQRRVDLVLYHCGAGHAAAHDRFAPVDDEHGLTRPLQGMGYECAADAGADHDRVVMVGGGCVPAADADARAIGPDRF